MKTKHSCFVGHRSILFSKKYFYVNNAFPISVLEKLLFLLLSFNLFVVSQ